MATTSPPFVGRTIFGISGKQRAGKDTLAALLQRRFNVSPPYYTRVGLADALKIEWGKREGLHQEGDVICRSDAELIALIDDLKNKDAGVRAALIDYGQARKRRNPAIWVERALETPGNLIIPDVRFLPEVERLYREALFPAAEPTRVFLVRVECPRELRLSRAQVAGGTLSNEEHHSECELDAFERFDWTVHNLQAHDLAAAAMNIAQSL